MFCKQCGAQMNDGTKFCPSCGAPQDVNESQPQGNAGAQSSQSDVDQNKGMAILAYIGILALIPYFAAPNSPYARFHAIQGMNLMILEIAFGIVHGIISAIFLAISWYAWYIIGIIFSIGWLAFGVLSIIGIINAAQGQTKALPLIDKIQIIKS